jgi:phage tail sheath protein FI
MGFLVSPGVEVNEIDLTNVIPAVSTSIGGFAGHFNWGPSGELINISSEKDLQANFGTPDSAHSVSFLVAASFLKYGNFLKVSRAVPTTARNSVLGNASAAVESAPIGNLEAFENLSTDANEYFIARCPGAYGNSLKVVIGHNGTTNTTITNNFDYVPSTTDAGLAADITGDEIHVIVIDEDGLFSGIKGTILEKFQGLSLASGAKLDTGATNYYKDVINAGSQYIFANALSDLFTNADAAIGTGAITDAGLADSPAVAKLTDGAFEGSLTLGVDGTLKDSEVVSALGLFADAESVDVNLLFADPMSTADDTDKSQKAVEAEVLSIAAARKDILGCGSAPIDLHTNSTDAAKLSAITANVPATTSNYFATTGSTVYVYNKYLDRYDWITTNGYLAGLCANTDDVAEPWFSPAGFNRGQILGAAKLSFNPKNTDRDALYKAAINPITNFPGQGIVLFGDKTFTQKPSAFDRINVRRLFIVLEKAIATAAKFQLFELNDEFTRAMFRNMTEPFLRDVKGRRGVTDFLVVCDETNNTGQVIDTNRFVADIYIKPARSINFITLNFVATRTGVEFSEIVGTN